MIKPYLRFNGNCEEAFNFYAEVFGGKIDYIARYEGQPGFENEPIGKIMHASVRLFENGCGLDGADSSEIPANYSPEVIVHFPSREQVEEIYLKLSRGAKSAEPFAPHVEGEEDEGGGACISDKYGITWFLCA